MTFIQPAFSREQVKKAGARLRDGLIDPNDVEILENWRASHLYVLNTFQANLRTRAKRFAGDVIVAQRLKRRTTIIDKLSREPNMQLSTMHDLAGCRVIFKNIAELTKFREGFEGARFLHERRHDRNKYNYIDNPKGTGYRGIHDVYSYRSSSTSGSQWNGLNLEIQYRTVFQHAWATAVEVIDLINRDRIKFNESDEDHREFFRLASELISRNFEGKTSCKGDLSDSQVVDRFREIETKTGFLEMLGTLSKSSSKAKLLTNSLLILKQKEDQSRPGSVDLSVETFKTILETVKKYNEYERHAQEKGILDIVFVRGANTREIALAYSNYFTDTADFCKYVNTAIENMKSP